MSALLMRNDTYKRIRRNVMRRVYTVYAARIVGSELLLYGAVFLTALAVFAKMVHVAKVFENLSSQTLGNMPAFALHAVMRGEVVTLAAIGVMVFAALSIQWRLRTFILPRLHWA